jgi:hypothetical protein
VCLLKKIIMQDKKRIMIRTEMPGIKFGNQSNQQNVQDFIKGQIYSKGFEFGAQPGPNTFNPNLGGAARRLFGLILFTENNNIFDPDLISLTINNEVIIDNVVWWAYNPQGPSGNIFKQAQYFELPRPMSGSDSVAIQYQSVNAHKIYPVFYLSDHI